MGSGQAGRVTDLLSAESKPMTYRFLSHTADVKVAIAVPSFEQLVAEGLQILQVLLAGERTVKPRIEHEIQVQGTDAADVWFRFLQEVLYRHATEAFVPANFLPDVITETSIAGTVTGEPFDPERHEPQPEVKAVTRHGLIVKRRGTGWYAEVLFDV
jgi:SHS2 domain-containing protein